jgi:putative transposase
MPNHFHFLIRQNIDVGLEKLISKTCTSYVSYFNKKYNHCGHVFQDAFKAKLVGNNSYLTYLSAYIHNNPPEPLSYLYSSLPTILGSQDEHLCDKSVILNYFGQRPKSYKKFVTGYTKVHEENIKYLTFEE